MQDPATIPAFSGTLKALVDTGLVMFILGAAVAISKQVIGMVLMFKKKNGNGDSPKKCALTGLDARIFQEHIADISGVLESDKRREAEHKEQALVLKSIENLMTKMVTIQETQTRILERIDGRR